jgi:hypothetical protein
MERSGSSSSSGMEATQGVTWLWLILEVAIEVFAAWTLAVHACMAVGAPAALAWPGFLVLVALLHFASRGRWRAARAAGRADANQAIAALTLGIGFSIPAFFQLTPSGDDFNFFHRAIWQLSHLGEPFTTADTAFSAEGLRAISPLHVLTTWELGIAMAAKAVGLDPLGVYHNGTIPITSALLAGLFVLWLRELGYGLVAALAGACGVFIFFLVDDPSFRSYAIAWRMLWVGKMVQWLLLFPMALLFSWRYLRDESPGFDRRMLLHPSLCAVAAVGLSGTGVFLLPGIFAAASLAALFSGPLSASRVVRCGALNVASLYCFVVAGLLLSGALAQPADMSAWTESFPLNWLDSLFLVFGHATGLARGAFFALAVPLVLLRGTPRRFIALYALALIAIFANPLTGPLWIEAAQPGSYWRVALLLPVSLGVAITLAAAGEALPRFRVRSDARIRPELGIGMLVLGVVLVVASGMATPRGRIRMQHEYGTKAPFALRVPAAHARFLEPVRNQLSGRRLLAAPGISTTAPLLFPSIQVDAARLKDTRHVFANVGRAEEGERRIAAWLWAGRCGPDPAGARAAAKLLASGTNALIVRDCRGAAAGPAQRAEAERARVLAGAGGRWSEVSRSDGYALYLRH